VVDVEVFQQLPGDAFGAGQDRFDRCAADQVGQAAYHPAGALVQVLVQRGQCSGLVLVQAQGVFVGDDQALPFTGQREGQRGDEGETPGDLPAADAGEQALDRGALLAGPRGDQVAGRFTLIPTSAFAPGQEWATLIAAIEGALRLYRHKDGSLIALADYLHRRTRGMIGSLLWLLRDASCQAILDGTEKITRKNLDQIAVDMTAQAPPPRTGAARR
jgi:hypothetical protein